MCQTEILTTLAANSLWTTLPIMRSARCFCACALYMPEAEEVSQNQIFNAHARKSPCTTVAVMLCDLSFLSYFLIGFVSPRWTNQNLAVLVLFPLSPSNRCEPIFLLEETFSC